MGFAHFPTKKHSEQKEVYPITDTVVNGVHLQKFPYIDSGFEGTTFPQRVRGQRRSPISRFRNTFQAEKIKGVQ